MCSELMSTCGLAKIVSGALFPPAVEKPQSIHPRKHAEFIPFGQDSKAGHFFHVEKDYTEVRL